MRKRELERVASKSAGILRAGAGIPQNRCVTSLEQGHANKSTYFNVFKHVGDSGSGISTCNASPAACSAILGPSNPSLSLATGNLLGVAPGAATAVGSQSDAWQGPSQTPAAGIRILERIQGRLSVNLKLMYECE
ncbi:hypothetical protein BDV93DRAFT_509243 [Ceratobasidium sp. AG-I]|nr:hypothetical protein BDV93DRAFT_509243 [Ceratobasidium sp. AG-I]